MKGVLEMNRTMHLATVHAVCDALSRATDEVTYRALYAVTEHATWSTTWRPTFYALWETTENLKRAEIE